MNIHRSRARKTDPKKARKSHHVTNGHEKPKKQWSCSGGPTSLAPCVDHVSHLPILLTIGPHARILLLGPIRWRTFVWRQHARHAPD
jgi:hypothetical protein